MQGIHRRTASLLLATPERIGPASAKGFTFLALGSDGDIVAAGMKRTYQAFQTCQEA